MKLSVVQGKRACSLYKDAASSIKFQKTAILHVTAYDVVPEDKTFHQTRLLML